MKCLDPDLGKLILNADILDDSDLREKVKLHKQACSYCRAQWNKYLALIKEIGRELEYHPTTNHIYNYASVNSTEKLNKTETEQISRHLQICLSCQYLVDHVKENDMLLVKFLAGEELPADLTKEQEDLFTKRVMTTVSGTHRANLVEIQSSSRNTKSWYENLLQFLLKQGFVFPKIVEGGLGLATIVLVIMIYLNISTEEKAIMVNSNNFNKPPNLNVITNSTNQNENNNQAVPTPTEELAEINQKGESPTVVENRQVKDKSEQYPEIGKKTQYTLNDVSGLIAVNSDGTIRGLSDYPSRVREDVTRTLLSNNPEFLAPSGIEFTEITQRGNSSQSTPFALHPNGKISRSDRPLFKWDKYDGAENYVVTVFDPDNKFTRVISSNHLQTLSWSPEQSLKRGHIYSWELKVELNDGSEKTFPEEGIVKFKILDPLTEKELRRAEAVKPKSHLTLGILYAHAGLFEDAEKEFLELQRLNPNSKKVKDLLTSVQSKIKR